MDVSIRMEVVNTSVQRLKIQSISVTVLLATAWQLTTEAVCHKVGFGIIKLRIWCVSPLYPLTQQFRNFQNCFSEFKNNQIIIFFP